MHKKEMHKPIPNRSFFYVIGIPFLLSLLAGLGLTFLIYRFQTVVAFVSSPFSRTSRYQIPKERLKEYAFFEQWFYVDPNILKKNIDTKTSDFLLVDLRSKEEYKAGHIVGAINIPAYQNFKDISSLDKRENEIVSAFKTIKENKGLVLYSSSSFSTVHRAVAFFLLKNEIDCRILSVGWNEWRHLTNFWLPEKEWGAVDMQSYITIP